MFFTLAALLHSIVKKTHNALPASMHVPTTRSIGCRVGTILNASCSKAMLTIEAALVLPFFIITFLSLVYFIHILGFQSSLQIRLEETARKLNTFAYISEDSGTTLSESDIFSFEIIRNIFFSEDIKSLCNSVLIKNGKNGISFYHTKIDNTDKTADIMITYDISIPFIPGNIIQIPFVQRCKFKLFTGNPETASIRSNSTIVYMTAHGAVYHTNKYCSYLIKYTDVLSKNELSGYEKTVGRNFELCRACAKIVLKDSNPIIYISKTGTVYHYSRDCYYLTSHIFEYNLKDIKDHFPLCSRCSSH